MSSVAGYTNGVLSTGNTLKDTKEASGKGASLDKDAFLQLLVAQMKYQDPLQPTSNTEYISQLATFSELEEMQNIGQSMDLQRASALVGKEVIVKSVSETGKESFVSGKVDYVVMEKGKAMLSINETLYPIADLDTVCDEAYLKAYQLASDLVATINQLPAMNNVSLSDEKAVQTISQIYEKMTDYEKSFVASEKKQLLNAYIARIQELKAAKA